MNSHGMGLARLSLLIQRLLDADSLNEAEGAPLLLETEAARQSMEAGDTETAHHHIAQVAHYTRTLLRTRRLAEADGCAVITTAHEILSL